MAFNETLAARIRDALARKRGVEEKKRFVKAASCSTGICSTDRVQANGTGI